MGFDTIEIKISVNMVSYVKEFFVCLSMITKILTIFVIVMQMLLLKTFECDFCGDFITTTKKELEEHLDEEKRFCMYCKMDYDCVYYLKEHIESDHKQLI